MFLDRAIVVVDISDGKNVAVGFNTDQAPRAVFPSIVGRTAAMKDGKIRSVDTLAKVADKAITTGLRVGADEHAILFIGPPLPPKINGAKLADIALKRLGAPAFGLVNGALAVLHASGKTTGLAVIAASDRMYAAPVIDGKVQYESVKALSWNASQSGDAPATTLDAMFKPNLLGLEQDGIHKLAFNAIKTIPTASQTDLYANVVMSGGTTMFPGIDERMSKELVSLAPDSMTIKIMAPPERKYSAWIGGAGLSSLSTFEEMWISKNEYDEAGPSIVARKCT